MSKKTPLVSRTLLVKDAEGEFKVTLPDGARVTFGPDVPFQKVRGFAGENDGFGRKYSLRIYLGKGNETLIACFSGVASFRDVSLPHAKLVVREAGKSMWKSDETGYEVQHNVSREQNFVDSARLLGS